MESTKDSLASIQKNMGKIAKACPDFMTGFRGLMKAIEEGGVLDEKTVELIIVGIAVSKQCSYCIDIHVANALKAGASKEEILAAAQCAVLMSGGPGLMYMQYVVQALDELAE